MIMTVLTVSIKHGHTTTTTTNKKPQITELKISYTNYHQNINVYC